MPQICMLNETHVTDNCDTSGLKINGYNFVNCNSYSKHTGGVCAFIHKDIKYKNVSVVEQQCAWYLSLEISVNNESYVFACVYLSSSENKSIVLDSFDKWIDELAPNKPVIICGDFNIDMSCDTTFSRRLTDICDENNLMQLVNKPTRTVENSATLIDLCLSNIEPRLISCDVLDDDQISDHSLIEITVSGKIKATNIKKREITYLSGYDRNIFCESLENRDFLPWEIFTNLSVDSKM